MERRNLTGYFADDLTSTSPLACMCYKTHILCSLNHPSPVWILKNILQCVCEDSLGVNVRMGK